MRDVISVTVRFGEENFFRSAGETQRKSPSSEDTLTTLTSKNGTNKKEKQ